MYKKYTGGLWLLFLLVFTAGAQSVPLGDAAKFALLAGGDIRANTAVQAMDYAGAGYSIDTMVTARNMYLRGEASQALSSLAEAMAYCNNQEGKELNREIIDVELEESVYKVGSSVVLGGKIILHGDARSVFIFNIAGNLDVKERTELVLGDVKPENVFWNVGGWVNVDKNTGFTGIVMAEKSIDFSVPTGLKLALLSRESIDFKAENTETVAYTGSFFSYNRLSSPTGTCDAPSTGPGARYFNAIKGRISTVVLHFYDFGTDASGQPFSEATWELELTDPNNGNMVYTVAVEVNNQGQYNAPDFTAAFTAKYGFNIPCGTYYARDRIYNACTESTTPFYAWISDNGRMHVNCFTISLPAVNVCLPMPATVTATVVKHPNLFGAGNELNNRNPSPIRWYWNNAPIANANSATINLPAAYLSQGGENTLKVEMDFTITGFANNAVVNYTMTESQSVTSFTPLPVTVSTEPAQVCFAGSATAVIANTQVGHTYQVCTTDNAVITCTNVAGQAGPMSVTLPFTQYGSYSVTVTDNLYPGCPTTVSFNIGGVQTLGTYGQVTTIDAANYPNHTVNFSGDYHVLGHLVFTNSQAATTTGTFNLTPGTRFYIESYGGINAPVTNQGWPTGTIIKVSGATLNLTGAILTETGCSNPYTTWGGIYITNSSILNTNQALVPDGSGGFRNQKTEIRNTSRAVYSYQLSGSNYIANTNRYYLKNTDIIGSNHGFTDMKKDGTVLAGEGIEDCIFENNISCIKLDQGPLGNYAPAIFRGNTFSGSGTGFWGFANNIKIESCQFLNTTYGIMIDTEHYGTSIPSSNCYVLGNTFQINNTGQANAYGIQTYDNYTITGNTFTGDLLHPATGIVANNYNNTISGNNTFTNLGIGVQAYWCAGLQVNNNTFTGNAVGMTIGCNNTNEFTGNTFTNNQTGIKFTATFYNPFGLPPVVRCNSFSAPNVTGSKGIYIEPGARVTSGNNPNRLAKVDEPSGNKFDGTVAEPVRNDGLAPLTYWVYFSSSEENVTQVHGTTGGTVPLGDPNADAIGACPPGPGIQARLAGRTAPINEPERTVYLGQSYPNPTQGQATVGYKLPSGTMEATILLRDVMTGKVVRTFKLPVSASESKLEIQLEGLRNGVYAYTLITGSKTVATKLLMISK